MDNHFRANKQPGIKIRNVPAGSPFFRAGLRNNDLVVAVNGEPVADELDFRFSAASPVLHIDIKRNGAPCSVTLKRRPGSFLEIEFHQEAIRQCCNKCIFCFIDQMPPGLRKSLYVKDEDLSHSFLNGNYVTLTNAGRAVLEKIVRRGLSPIFVSVHATDPLVRNRMLGVRRAPPIMEQLAFLARNNIRLHSQIVVCPGYNDGAQLAKTIASLFSLGPNLLSIAVVPVGLTRFRTFPLAPVDQAAAAAVCRLVSETSDRDATRNKKRRLFLADEFFLKAGEAVPTRAYYEEYPQIENGVGLVRQLLDNWARAKKRARKLPGHGQKIFRRRKRYLLLTSFSAFPFIAAVARDAEARYPGAAFRVEAVENRFLGPGVTVAGLLSARDVICSVRRSLRKERFERVLLPPVMFNYAGFTLDGYSAKRIAKVAGIAVSVVKAIEELLDI
jgi:putative radical SAM enzyme (TIGR03279 family)